MPPIITPRLAPPLQPSGTRGNKGSLEAGDLAVRRERGESCNFTALLVDLRLDVLEEVKHSSPGRLSEVESESKREASVRDSATPEGRTVGTHGRFVLDPKPIGEGWFSVVHFGVDRTNGRKVAIKQLKRRSDFPLGLREAKILESFGSSRYLPAFLEKIEVNDELFLCMDAVEGNPLEKGVRWPAREARDLIDHLLKEDLNSLHARRWVHCDLAPQNVLLRDNPDGTRSLKLVDFGSCQKWDTISGHADCQPNGGTAFYMPPEQKPRQDSVLSAATDIFAVAGLFYYLLAGRHPDGLFAIPDGELKDVLAKARSADPTQRFPDAMAFAAALESLTLDNEPLENPRKSFTSAEVYDLYARESGALEVAGFTPVASEALHHAWAERIGASQCFPELIRKLQLAWPSLSANQRAEYYGEFCARVAGLGVDFGGSRNATDPHQHARWAGTVSALSVLSELVLRLEELARSVST